MSVSFFPSFPYPDELGVNMTYSSFGEVREIVARLIDKEFGDLVHEEYADHYSYSRHKEVVNRLKEKIGAGFFEFFDQSDSEGEMSWHACKDFIDAFNGKDLNDIKDEYRRCQIKNILKMMQLVVDSPKSDAAFQWC